MSVGFIGAGRVARIMLGGWQRAQRLPHAVLACDQSSTAVAALVRTFPSVRASAPPEAAAADVVFAALHPAALTEALPVLAPHLKSDAIFCSLAPRLRLPTLIVGLGGFARVARMNPNAPSIVNAGFNPVAYGDGLPAAAREQLQALVAPLGMSPQVPDEHIETYAVISGIGPTYFWFQFEEVRARAEAFGLSPEEARRAVGAMLHGAVRVLLESGLPATEVLDLVPVRPLADDEPAIRAILRQRLDTMHQRLTG
jgi:pyrroline-5-carboxylate reductase